jgi:hypothetical protein
MVVAYKTESKDTGENGGDAVGTVPSGDSEGLFRSSIPLSSDDGE